MNTARLFFVACAVLSCYFIYTAGSGVLRSHRFSQQETTALHQAEELGNDKLYLEAVLDYISSDSYVEQEARRRLGYIRLGEIPVIVTSPTLGPKETVGGEWWERLFPR
ncbi:MAG TPA: septum formation initiator family protein [Dehalococcoidia bacterium]|jgi:cell division protein FtsB|nr:septum formation initiator family protein [Dehalococcoidia bacterium]